MTKQTQYPYVLLVGRTNVGKSTIFNRITNSTKSIVFDREGVTRDYVHEVVSWQDATFDLIDTGGIPLKPQGDAILAAVKERVIALMQNAALIVFVADMKHGVCADDLTIARLIHQSKRPAMAVINKADNPDIVALEMPEFLQLGFNDIMPLSATHGRGMAHMLEKMADAVKAHNEVAEVAPQDPSYKVAIVGKPNVGKSSLLNILLKEERAIVSNVAGTTREPISESIRLHHELIQLTDTAGVRRKKGVTDDLESVMVKTSFKAIKDADLVLLVIDGTEGKLSDQEIKLLFFAHEHKKAMIVVINKTDIIGDYAKDTMEMNQLEYGFILKKMPIVRISCVEKKNISVLRETIDTVWRRLKQPFNSTKVNEIVQEYLLHRPMYAGGLILKVFKVRHVEARVPSFVVHVNKPEAFGSTQLNCIENVLRNKFDLKGCPVNLVVRRI